MDRELIKKFAEKKDKQKVQEFYDIALNILTHAMTDLNSIKNNGVSVLNEDTTRIFPIGDYTNDTFIDSTGELEICIASSNPQLIMANNVYIKNLKEAKTKKKLALVSTEGTYDKIILDLVKCLTKYFDESTYLITVSDGIKILCLQEYGFKLMIRFATYSENDPKSILSFWDPVAKNIKPVNLFLYNENMEKKDKETKGNYKRLVRIFKNIRKNILMNKWASSGDLNKYFVEVIAYNIPNSLLQDNDLAIMFFKAVNYLDNCNALKFVSFDGSKIEKFSFAKINYAKIKNFTRYLVKLTF